MLEEAVSNWCLPVWSWPLLIVDQYHTCPKMTHFKPKETYGSFPLCGSCSVAAVICCLSLNVFGSNTAFLRWGHKNHMLYWRCGRATDRLIQSHNYIFCVVPFFLICILYSPILFVLFWIVLSWHFYGINSPNAKMLFLDDSCQVRVHCFLCEVTIPTPTPTPHVHCYLHCYSSAFYCPVTKCHMTSEQFFIVCPHSYCFEYFLSAANFLTFCQLLEQIEHQPSSLRKPADDLFPLWKLTLCFLSFKQSFFLERTLLLLHSHAMFA